MQLRKLTSRIAIVLAVASPLLVAIAGVQICTSGDALTAAIVRTTDLERLSDFKGDLAAVSPEAKSALLARHGFRSADELDTRLTQTQSEARMVAEGARRSTFLMLMTVLAALLSTCFTSLVQTRPR